jgi:hypothetical protein
MEKEGRKMNKSSHRKLIILWLMSPMIGLSFSGLAYIVFLFRDKPYIFALPLLGFIIGTVYLEESSWDKGIEEDE